MESNVKEINEKLIKFWDSAISLKDEDKKELKQYKDLDYKELAPSEKLVIAIESLKDFQRVLDYGCGNGWASVIAAKSGCQKVIAVDVIQGGVDATNFYADLFNLKNKIDAQIVSTDWIFKTPSEQYDGLICNNVLDVITLDLSREIIKNLARVLKKKGKAIIGFNFHLSEEMMAARGMKLEDEKYLFVDGVLRLVNLSDDEWKNEFAPYFNVDKLEFFAWPGENKETRRLFCLSKK